MREGSTLTSPLFQMFFSVTLGALTCADVTQTLDRVVTFNYLVPACLRPLHVSAAFSLQSSRGNISRVIFAVLWTAAGLCPKMCEVAANGLPGQLLFTLRGFQEGMCSVTFPLVDKLPLYPLSFFPLHPSNI